MLKTKNMLDEINLCFSTLQSFIRIYANLNFTDMNIVAEDLVADVLNLIFGWNLINVNNGYPNYPCIDLLDANREIGVQVTSEKGVAKINKTLSCISNHNLKLKRVLIFTLIPRQKSYSVKPASMEFDPKKDILDFDGLVAMIKHAPFEVLNSLHSKMKKYFPFSTNFLSDGLDGHILSGYKYFSVMSAGENLPRQEIIELIKNKNKELALQKLDNYAQQALKNSGGMLYEVANLYALVDPLKAELFYKTAANLYPQQIASANIHGLNLMKLGQLDEAELIFKSCLESSELTQTQREHLNGNLGVLAKKRSRYPEAIKYMRTALRLTNKEDNEGFANHFNNLGSCYNHLENFVRSGRYFKMAHKLIDVAIELEDNMDERNRLNLKKSNFLTNTAIQLQYLSAKKKDRGLLLEAKKLLLEAIRIAELLKEKTELTRHYGNLSNVYKALKEYELTNKYLKKSLEMAISNNDRHGELTNLVNLGNLMIEQGALGDAESFLIEALCEEINSYPKLSAELFGNFSILYKKQGNSEQSKINFSLAENIYENLRLPERVLKLYDDLEAA